MKKIFMVLISLSLLVSVVSGCGSLQTRNESVVTVNPSKSHEECVDMMPRDVLTYSFKSTEPVDFNIHYHEVEKISYPVAKKNSTGEEGRFDAEKEQIYCLMWTNTQKEPVQIKYTFRLEKRTTTPSY